MYKRESFFDSFSRVVACPVELSVQNSDVFFELGESIARFMKAVSIFKVLFVLRSLIR